MIAAIQPEALSLIAVSMTEFYRVAMRYGPARRSGGQARFLKEAPLNQGLLELAEWTGLEPATPGVTGRYSNQLNYHSGHSGGC